MKAHDGRHIKDFRRYFEWWYFDIDAGKGNDLYVEWHAPIFNCRTEQCILVIRAYSDGAPFFANRDLTTNLPGMRAYSYPRSQVAIQDGICDIRWPGGKIWEENGTYYLEIAEKEISMSLCLENALPAYGGSEEILFKTENNRETFLWHVPLPRARARGEVRTEKRWLAIDGLAYHDHNWGNLNIGKELKSWVWTRIFFKEYTLVYGELSGRKGGKKYVLYLIDSKGETLTDISPKVVYGDKTDRREYGIDLIRELSISFGPDRQNRVALVNEKDLGFQEFPLSSFGDHRINASLAGIYYLLGKGIVGKEIRRIIGRGVYHQFATRAEMIVDRKSAETGEGKTEAIYFGI